MEEIVLFIDILDVGVDKEGIGLTMDILHGNLEAIEAPCFWYLYFGAELLGEVFKDDAIGGSEECKDILDEMLLITAKFLPIFEILIEVDFLSSPETGQMLLVHVPDVIILDREEDEAVRVVFKQGLFTLVSLV